MAVSDCESDNGMIIAGIISIRQRIKKKEEIKGSTLYMLFLESLEDKVYK